MMVLFFTGTTEQTRRIIYYLHMFTISSGQEQTDFMLML